MNEFAEDYPRNDDGWILFPSDSSWRKSLFPPEVADHPAKMQLHLQKAIIDYVSIPGDILLDPFGGTGSIMIGALQGRTTILLELEESYHQLQQRAYEKLKSEHPNMSPVVLLLGDNRFLLPLPCNHIVTSPPYANMLHQRTIRKGDEDDEFVKMDRMINAYSKHPRNIGALNDFLYNQAMEKVYKLCYESLIPGGTITIVLKDKIRDGKRILLTKWADRVCKKLGLQPILHEKWKTPGIQFTAINKMHGFEVVEDESVMIYRKAT